MVDGRRERVDRGCAPQQSCSVFIPGVRRATTLTVFLLACRTADGGIASDPHTALRMTEQTDSAGVAMTHSAPEVIQRVDMPGVGLVDLDLTLFAPGAAAGDFNGDGREDLFVLGGGNVADALFINNGNGSFTNRAVEWGVAKLHVGFGAAVGDYDHDGRLDLFLTSLGAQRSPAKCQHILYHNNANGTFTNVAATAGVACTTRKRMDGFGATWGDYNNDGRLDLFVSGWILDDPTDSRNVLFRNNGNGTFTDVTEPAGLKDPLVRGFTPCFSDMNGDGRADLLIAADFGSSRYFINNRDGTFTNATATTGVQNLAYGMGATVADFNSDGRPDWYVGSIYYDPSVKISGMSNPFDGNKLFLSDTTGRYLDRAVEVGVENGHFTWGTLAADFDLDGWTDLVTTGGFPMLDGLFLNDPTRLWLNGGKARFTEVSKTIGIDHDTQGRGLARIDYDADGAPDLLITSTHARLRLYRNDIAGGHWVRIRLDTRSRRDLAPHGIGSKVTVRSAGRTQTDEMRACPTFLSQSELTAHFGLGAAATIDEIRVTWPDGKTTVMTGVPANQTLTITP
jgi:hypothetical protein